MYIIYMHIWSYLGVQLKGQVYYVHNIHAIHIYLSLYIYDIYMHIWSYLGVQLKGRLQTPVLELGADSRELYIYICIYVYIYLYIYIYVCMYVYRYIHMSIYIYTYIET